jgi:hypothetical protein
MTRALPHPRRVRADEQPTSVESACERQRLGGAKFGATTVVDSE